MKVKELKEERRGIHSQMKDIQSNADKEKRSLSKEEVTRFDALDDEFEAKSREIEVAEKMEARQALMDSMEGETIEERTSQKENGGDEVEKRQKSFEKYLRRGMSSLNVEERSHLRMASVETRAQTTQTGSSGGFTIPTLMADRIWEALLDFGGARALGTNIRTEGGEQIDYPTTNDTENIGELLAENTQTGEQDIEFGTVPLNAFTFTSKMIKVPNQLLQDSKFDIGGHIIKALQTRIGRSNNQYFTNGTGAGQPMGFITAAVSGLSAASATAITFDELIELEHSVGSAYRKGAKFTFADSTLKAIKKLKDGDGNYLWQMGDVKSGAPATINGYQYEINDDVPAMATTAKAVAFGDFSNFLIRDVGTPSILRLSERYADFNQTAFVVFTRSDSEMINAGTNPVKVITMG